MGRRRRKYQVLGPECTIVVITHTTIAFIATVGAVSGSVCAGVVVTQEVSATSCPTWASIPAKAIPWADSIPPGFTAHITATGHSSSNRPIISGGRSGEPD